MFNPRPLYFSSFATAVGGNLGLQILLIPDHPTVAQISEVVSKDRGSCYYIYYCVYENLTPLESYLKISTFFLRIQ